jgi:aspartate/methionine/tyrosine aminotransferase
MEQGELDFPTPAFIVEAANEALHEGYTKYAPSSGLAELKIAIAEKLRDANGIDSDPETEILVTQGSTQGLYLAILALLQPGEEALILDPSYPPYDRLVRSTGAIPKHVPSYEEDEWLASVEAMEQTITPRTRVVMVNTPNNPTGAVYPRSYLEAIGELASKHNLMVVSDEAYEALTYDGNRHVSPASIDSLQDLCVALFSFSKTYAMTGWRLGYLHGPHDFIKRAGTIHNLVLAHVTSHIQIAGARALTGPQDCLDQMHYELDRRRKVLVEELNRVPHVSCRLPKGAFYAFPNFGSIDMSSIDLATRLASARVGTSPGVFFGKSAEGYVRMSFSTVNFDQIKLAVGRIKEAIS